MNTSIHSSSIYSPVHTPIHPPTHPVIRHVMIISPTLPAYGSQLDIWKWIEHWIMFSWACSTKKVDSSFQQDCYSAHEKEGLKMTKKRNPCFLAYQGGQDGLGFIRVGFWRVNRSSSDECWRQVFQYDESYCTRLRRQEVTHSINTCVDLETWRDNYNIKSSFPGISMDNFSFYQRTHLPHSVIRKLNFGSTQMSKVAKELGWHWDLRPKPQSLLLLTASWMPSARLGSTGLWLLGQPTNALSKIGTAVGGRKVPGFEQNFHCSSTEWERQQEGNLH